MVFAYADDYGRVWSGEYDDIVAQNSRNRSVSKMPRLQVGNADAYIADFVLAGDKLVVLAVGRF